MEYKMLVYSSAKNPDFSIIGKTTKFLVDSHIISKYIEIVDNVYELQDNEYSDDAIKYILNFIYNQYHFWSFAKDEEIKNKSIYQELLILLDKFNIPKLKDKCIEFYRLEIKNNPLYVLYVSCIYKFDELKDKSLDMILNSDSDVKKEWIKEYTNNQIESFNWADYIQKCDDNNVITKLWINILPKKIEEKDEEIRLLKDKIKKLKQKAGTKKKKDNSDDE